MGAADHAARGPVVLGGRTVIRPMRTPHFPPLWPPLELAAQHPQGNEQDSEDFFFGSHCTWYAAQGA